MYTYIRLAVKEEELAEVQQTHEDLLVCLAESDAKVRKYCGKPFRAW